MHKVRIADQSPAKPASAPATMSELQLDCKTSCRLDWLRVLITFFVVGIHTNYSTLHTSYWVSGFSAAIDVLYRTAVPSFFILTGFLVLDSATLSWNFVKKRVNRILVPWLSWSAVYLIIRAALWKQEISLLCLITGDTFYHLWFMYQLLNIYLVAPIFGSFVRCAGISKVVPFTIFAFALNILYSDFSSLLTYLHHYSAPSAIRLPGVDQFIILVLAGWCIRHSKAVQGSYLLWMVVFVVTYLSILFFCLFRSLQIGKLDESAYYQSLVIPMSISFFTLFTYHAPAIPFSISAKKLSDLSFGVYLSHPFVIYALQVIDFPFLKYIPLFATILVFTLSIALVAFIKRTPILCHCV